MGRRRSEISTLPTFSLPSLDEYTLNLSQAARLLQVNQVNQKERQLLVSLNN